MAIILLLLLLCTPLLGAELDPLGSVYTIPYVRSFRQDLIEKSIGCGFNIAYSSYTHPDGLRDAAHIVANQYQFGGIRCQPREMYVKIFGYAQDYSVLGDGLGVAAAVKRNVNGKFKSVIVDWKNKDGDLKVSQDFLNAFIKDLADTGIETYLKVPASYLCKNFQGKPYILSIPSVKKIIVETYGQDSSAYKNKNQLFLSSTSESATSEEYPNASCPKFPSLTQLRNGYPQIDFFIEKTLQQEEPGYLGEHFLRVMEEVKEFYGKKVFYDSFPPALIRF